MRKTTFLELPLVATTGTEDQRTVLVQVEKIISIYPHESNCFIRLQGEDVLELDISTTHLMQLLQDAGCYVEWYIPDLPAKKDFEV